MLARDIIYGHESQMSPMRGAMYSKQAYDAVNSARRKALAHSRAAATGETKASAANLASLNHACPTLFYYDDDIKRYEDGRIGLEMRVSGNTTPDMVAEAHEHALFIRDEFKLYGLPMDVWKEYPELEIYDGVKAKTAACVYKILRGVDLLKIEDEFGADFLKELIGCPDNCILASRRGYLLKLYDEAHKAYYEARGVLKIEGWNLPSWKTAELEKTMEARKIEMDEILSQLNEKIGKN